METREASARRSALHYAAYYDQAEMCKLLLDLSADAGMRDLRGRVPVRR